MNRGMGRTNRRCWMWGLSIVGLLSLFGALYLLENSSVPPTQKDDLPTFEYPPISKSRFLNTSSQAAYVGSEACANCHADEFRTYLQTAHSQTLSDIDLSTEPSGGEFDHAPSGRSYRVYRKGDQLRHREFVRISDGEELVLSDFAMRYSIGSGRHSRSYLVETEGFLVESPVTWYASRQAWGMSPGSGYDDPEHWAFERVTDVRCLICHVGRVESVDDSFHRLKIHEQSIGCERCHSPGSLHVERWNSGAESISDIDPTIVHPGRLAREINESICAQCHLSGAVAVDVRGRNLVDFRPGLPLKDFRIHFAFQSADKSMKVVGHMEQMRLSRCYQASETLTCTTCHTLHAKPTDEERLTFYRKKCLSCHTDRDCGLVRAERVRKNSQDNCVACHMPRVPTDIPHFAFTHHRIGKHNPEQTTDEIAKQPGTLVPLDDVSHLSQIDQERCLGLAYVQLLDEGSHAGHAATYYRRARELLEDVRRRGLRDPEVDAALARLFWRKNSQKTIAFAEAALRSDELSPATRVDVLWILGSCYFDLNETDRAIRPLEQLVRLHRNAEAWLLLDVCHYRAGDKNSSLEAARHAAQISPYRSDLQGRLADLYRQIGNSELAKKHQSQAIRLIEALPPKPERDSPPP